MENLVCHRLAHSSLRYSRIRTLQPKRSQEPLCYRPKVRKVSPESHALHHFVTHNFQHTKTHILGPLSGFGGIPVLLGSFPPQNGCMWAPSGLHPLDFSPRGSTNVFSLD